MFSVPRPSQLNEYTAKIDRDRSLGPVATRVLLSPCKPAWFVDGWRHISYGDLAARLRDERGSFCDSYLDETVLRYAAMVEQISAILDVAVDVSDPAAPWLVPDPGRALQAARLSDGCAKLRADAVATLLEADGNNYGIGDRIYVKSGLTNKTPFVEIFQNVGVGADRIGWQLQGNDWRLAAVLPTLVGRTQARRRAREARASELASWFDFSPLASTVPASARAPGPAEKWKRFDPDFVYRSRPVPGITLAQVLTVGMEYARQAVAIGSV